MKYVISMILVIFLLIVPVNALDISAPEAPEEALPMMPEENETFGQGVLHILKEAIQALYPSISDSAGICLSLSAIAMLTGLFGDCFNNSAIANVVGALASGVLLLAPSNALIQESIHTVTEIEQYSKLLLPALSAVLAAQGASVTAAALHTGTLVFTTVLVMLITRIIVPLIYAFICLSVVASAIGQDVLSKLQNLIKGVSTWSMKAVLYIFTGYMTITSAVSGTTDAAALKATKIAISGAVPVVGGILSDASEAVLISAGILKNSVGVYGLLAVLAIGITPFLRAGVYYMLLKLTSVICGIWGSKKGTGLIQDASTAMGYIVAMTGTVCILLFIGIICFLKGVRL